MDKVDEWIKLISNSSACLHWRWLVQGGIGPGTPRELQAVQGVETLGDGAWQIEIQIERIDGKNKYKVDKYKQKYKITKLCGSPVDEALRDQAIGQSCSKELRC